MAVQQEDLKSYSSVADLQDETRTEIGVEASFSKLGSKASMKTDMKFATTKKTIEKSNTMVWSQSDNNQFYSLKWNPPHDGNIKFSSIMLRSWEKLPTCGYDICSKEENQTINTHIKNFGFFYVDSINLGGAKHVIVSMEDESTIKSKYSMTEINYEASVKAWSAFKAGYSIGHQNSKESKNSEISNKMSIQKFEIGGYSETLLTDNSPESKGLGWLR